LSDEHAVSAADAQIRVASANVKNLRFVIIISSSITVVQVYFPALFYIDVQNSKKFPVF